MPCDGGLDWSGPRSSHGVLCLIEDRAMNNGLKAFVPEDHVLLAWDGRAEYLYASFKRTTSVQALRAKPCKRRDAHQLK
jgi:hypothetical protein